MGELRETMVACMSWVSRVSELRKVMAACVSRVTSGSELREIMATCVSCEGGAVVVEVVWRWCGGHR